ncbi:hypothetical protein ZIOFF_039381 [Zingiber officinale]|uniref:Uncharacterized protein n=1 Tax=Zingiber officinale TaxID=94328 RepID=A0A8J5G4P5_ZINOF|nr:hypothetical protein ZIOFF_039381 [Zingiber officinale]
MVAIAATEQRVFQYEMLVVATRNFNPKNKLGEGGFSRLQGIVAKTIDELIQKKMSWVLIRVLADEEECGVGLGIVVQGNPWGGARASCSTSMSQCIPPSSTVTSRPATSCSTANGRPRSPTLTWRVYSWRTRPMSTPALPDQCHERRPLCQGRCFQLRLLLKLVASRKNSTFVSLPNPDVREVARWTLKMVGTENDFLT